MNPNFASSNLNIELRCISSEYFSLYTSSSAGYGIHLRACCFLMCSVCSEILESNDFINCFFYLFYSQQNISFLIRYLRVHKQVVKCLLSYWKQYGSWCGNTQQRQIWKKKKNGRQSFCCFRPKRYWATKRKFYEQ